LRDDLVSLTENFTTIVWSNCPIRLIGLNRMRSTLTFQRMAKYWARRHQSRRSRLGLNWKGVQSFST
jgi:hypothetical protein